MPLYSGRTPVTTAGTRVRLSSEEFRRVDTVAVTAFTDNSDYVTIGGENVVGAEATRVGHPLAAGATIILGDEVSEVFPGDVWVDAIVNGEGVTWIAL